MFMKFHNMIKILICSATLALYGCGGGGGGETVSPLNATDPATPVLPATQTTKISGTASAAPISGGTVNVYKIVNGVKSDLAGTGKTDGNGKYSAIDIGTYTGAVVVEITGGSYTDEATGSTIPLDAPLHAVLANVAGNVTSAVTPLTELAYQQTTGSNLTTAAINSANQNVGDMFKISDIIATQPVAPTATDLKVLSLTNLSEKDKYNYTLVLIALSQMSKELNTSVAGTITYIKNQSSAASLNSTGATSFQTAVTNYFKIGNSNNKTGITDSVSTALVTVGGKKAIVKLSTSGNLPAGKNINGISVNIALPSGVTIKSDTNGILATYLYTSGVSEFSSSTINGSANGNNVTINLVRNDSGLSVTGEFATLECDVAYNAPSPLGSFTVSPGYKVSSLVNGTSENLASSITVTTSVVIQ
jgi:hypothetical protein